MMSPTTRTFADELAEWGPAAPQKNVSPAAAAAYCRQLATSHYENFQVASWLLPRRLRQPFFNVYAYCRWADDLGDEVDSCETALRLLDWWDGQLNRCYAGDCTHPVFVALSQTIREFEIPLQPFADLLSAFKQDQQVRKYDTYTQLVDYCRRSANPVGRLVLRLLGKDSVEHVGWSDSICTGLQLANFWQDVARDFDIGRVYLPAEDLTRFGYSNDDLAHRRTTPQFIELMRFQVERARLLLRPWDADPRRTIGQFPFRFQIELEAFARGGLCILDRISGIGYRVWEQRPKVSKRDAAGILCKSVWSAGIRCLRYPMG